MVNENINEKWRQLCASYLNEVERALEGSGHPRSQEVLDDLKSHLAQRYRDLPVQERTPENLRVIIDQMGSPEEHAEILSEDGPPRSPLSYVLRSRHCRRWGLAALAVALIVFGFFWPSVGLPVLLLMMYAALTGALVFRYIRTHDAGFLWLGLAVVIWPLIAGMISNLWLRSAIERLAAGQKVGMFPFTLVENAQMTLGSLMMILSYVNQLINQGLFFIAVVKIARYKK